MPETARDWVVVASAVALGLTAFYVFLPLFIQRLMRVILSVRYSFRVAGGENVPKAGPAIVAANHLSWVDGFVLASVCPRNGKAMVNADIINQPLIRPLALRAGMIPTPFSGPRAIRERDGQGARGVSDTGPAWGSFPKGRSRGTACSARSSEGSR